MALFNGTIGNDTLIGTAGSDTLIGNAGNDYLDGGIGADSLLGGTGNDIYVVDNTADVLIESSQEGNDQVLSSITYTLRDNFESLILTGGAAINGTGNNLDNTLQGNAGNNVLNGGNGADYLLGNGGNDTLVGGAGADYLSGGSGIDSLIGGTDDDVYVVEDQSDTIVEKSGEGYDEVRAANSYTLSSTQEIEALTLSGTASVNGFGNNLANDIVGNRGDNLLQGLAGNDWLFGGLGNDVLNGGTGDDILEGGAGNDTYIVEGLNDQVIENPGSGRDLISTSVSYVLGANLEDLTLTGSAAVNGTGNNMGNILRGNEAANILTTGTGNDSLFGYSGNDTIISGAGNDLLSGGTGNDSMTGGIGDDTYIIDSIYDKVIENTLEGQDSIRLNLAERLSFAMTDNIESAFIDNSLGCTITGNILGNSMTGNGGADALLDVKGGDDTLSGLGGDDTLWGGFGNNYLSGGNGNDELTGAGFLSGDAGNDYFWAVLGDSTLSGGNGNDFYELRNNEKLGKNFKIIENNNEGWDSVLTDKNLILQDNIEELILEASKYTPIGQSLDGTGNSLANIIRGDQTANTLKGAGGNDTLEGGEGIDTYYGGLNSDSIIDLSLTSTDHYYWGRNEGTDVMTDKGGSDSLNIFTGVSANQVWLEKISEDLKISIVGSTDSISIKDWFATTSSQIESIKLADGKTLSSTHVEILVDAMAQFAAPPIGTQFAPSALNLAIETNWL